MTSYPSIGDQSRSYQMRLSQYLLKSRLDRLSKEVTTGLKDDIPLALNGDLSRISHIENRLTMLDAYQQNASEAKTKFEAMQLTLERIQTAVEVIGPNLLNQAGGSPEEILRLNASEATEEFRAIFGSLNTSASGRHIFSGTRTDTAPLASFEDMITGLNTAVSGAVTAADISNRIAAWFDAPVGGGGFSDTVYRGGSNGNSATAISSERMVGSDLTANSDELRRAFKGMAVMAYVSELGAGLDPATIRELSNTAGLELFGASVDLINAQAVIGTQEAAISQAQAQNTAERSSLSIARSKLIAADPYETATALKETEASIQSLYMITSRLSRLSLTDYLS